MPSLHCHCFYSITSLQHPQHVRYQSPVSTVPWPLMAKQWSMWNRKGAEPPLSRTLTRHCRASTSSGMPLAGGGAPSEPPAQQTWFRSGPWGLYDHTSSGVWSRLHRTWDNRFGLIQGLVVRYYNCQECLQNCLRSSCMFNENCSSGVLGLQYSMKAGASSDLPLWQ